MGIHDLSHAFGGSFGSGSNIDLRPAKAGPTARDQVLPEIPLLPPSSFISAAIEPRS
jgi:hypothetical protein